MILSIKELVVILVIGVVVFRFATPIFLVFSKKEDYLLRRNAWCLLTAAAFLSPNFWIFAAIAIPYMSWAGCKDSNPAGLFLMLMHLIPRISVPIPMIGMSSLFAVDNYMMLSFTVLAPASLRLLKKSDRPRGLHAMDVCLLAYGTLTAFMFVHPEIARGVVMTATFTDCLRRVLVFFFSTYLPYFLISRSSWNRRALLDALSAFCLSCALLAAIGGFEAARHWLLYGEVAERWGYGAGISLYVARGSSLRATASTGYPLALGFLLAIGFGYWLYLQTRIQSVRPRLAVTALLWSGLLAAYSRGPWIGAILIYFTFSAMSPRGFFRIIKAAALAITVGALVLISPLGENIVAVLPFLGGNAENETIVYRQQLFARSWEIIMQSPFFGDPDALLKMQDLRQGQGIIDLVNSYLEILMNNGLVGLTLLMAFVLIGMGKAWALSRRANRRGDTDGSILAASLIACLVGTLVMIENGGLDETMLSVLVAFAAGFAYSDMKSPAHPSQQS